VRPENVRLGGQLDTDDVRHEGTVVTSTFCGPHWKVFIESLGKTVIAYAPAGLAGAERTPGQSVAWGFRAADVMEFATA